MEAKNDKMTGIDFWIQEGRSGFAFVLIREKRRREAEEYERKRRNQKK